MRRRSRGFCWVEVIVAIFVVMYSMLLFGATYPMAVKTQTMVSNYQQAASFAQHKIDQLRAIGYGRLNFTEMNDADVVDDTPTTSPYSFAVSDALSTIYPNATGVLTLTARSSTVMQVTVTITWTGSASVQGNGSVTATALISKQ